MMKSKFLAFFLVSALAVALGVSACSKAEEQPAEPEGTPVLDVEEEIVVDGSAYGYAGTDPIVCAVYKYLVEETGKHFDEADVCIPSVSIVNIDDSNPDDVVVRGDFWVLKYNINGDTLECVSGGDFPGVMHVVKGDDGYVVSSMDVVADGSEFDSSARELFGDYYDDFMSVNSDREAAEALRKAIVSDYVRLNGLDVSYYQDYGWDPVELDK